MSEFGRTRLGQDVMSLDVSEKLAEFSKVIIIAGQDSEGNDIIFQSGTDSGRTLTIQNEWGSQAQADNILNAIRGYRYQPLTASGAQLDPAAELGDAVTVNGVYGGIFKMSRAFGHLITADIEAPHDEEIDHEYPYEGKTEREFKRELSETSARIRLNATSIAMEVARATAAEGNLQSSIDLNAEAITAKVSKTGGSSSSFSWTLTSSAWTLNAGSKEVFKVNKDGAVIEGTIRATEGKIGGFTIKESDLHNGMTSLGDTKHNGVYIGTDGIALGKGRFKVDDAGNLTAADAKLTGTLTIGSETIGANELRQGASRANSGYSGWNSSKATVDTITSAKGDGSSYLRGQIIYAKTAFQIGNENGFQIGTTYVKKKSTTVAGVTLKYWGYD